MARAECVVSRMLSRSCFGKAGTGDSNAVRQCPLYPLTGNRSLGATNVMVRRINTRKVKQTLRQLTRGAAVGRTEAFPVHAAPQQVGVNAFRHSPSLTDRLVDTDSSRSRLISLSHDTGILAVELTDSSILFADVRVYTTCGDDGLDPLTPDARQRLGWAAPLQALAFDLSKCGLANSSR